MPQETQNTFSDQRIQTSFLAGPEKKALLWLAPRMPQWVTPDVLTYIGLFGMGMCGLGYYLATKHWIFLVISSLGHVVNWFGDSLDGTLARYRKQQRPKYGYYLDHLVDAFGMAIMIFGLAYSGLAHQTYIWLVLCLFFIASINTYLVTSTTGVFKISYLRFSTTEARVALILMNTMLIFVQNVNIFGLSFRWMDVLAILVSLFLLVAIIRSACKTLTVLDKQERALWKNNADE